MSTTARWAVVAAAVFVVGCVVRVGLVLASPGGPSGSFGYDPGVYYAAADALSYGRLPYRDFVMLHPPGLMLVGVPFAVIGRLTTDHTGFITANAAFSLLGAANAALVVIVCKRAGLSAVAAALGGLFYAVWFGAAAAEVSVRLEPLGSTAFLCGLLALTSTRTPRWRDLIVAGSALGFAASVKVWWIVPLLIALAWQFRQGSRRATLALAGGALVTGLVVNGPFFVSAPHAMWRMVVTDQLGRQRFDTSILSRMDQLTSVQSALPGIPTVTRVAALGAVVLIAAALTLAAWRVPACRFPVVVVAAQVLVLLLSPSYFAFYADYPAAAASLVIAGAAHSSRSGLRVGRTGLAAAGICVTLALTATVTALVSRPISVTPFPAVTLAGATARSRCVMADSPIALIELNVLSRDLARGCRNWVDVSGRTYDVDAPPAGRNTPRASNVKWQSDLRRYLLSGDEMITIRAATGYGGTTKNALQRLPTIARVGRFVLRDVPRVRAGD